MNKLKEIKGKSEESGGKARQYLEGLLRIPFGVYREEPILRMLKYINDDFKRLNTSDDTSKEKYTNTEIYMHIRKLEDVILTSVSSIDTRLSVASKTSILNVMKYINDTSSEKIKWSKIKTKEAQLDTIMTYINSTSLSNKVEILNIIDTDSSHILKTHVDIVSIHSKLKAFNVAFREIDTIFDKSIYGHKHAKQQMKKIIGQWITGKQTGAAFGFEGSPGLGKTSFAKNGLANCLIDEDGTSRPFKFIAVGGSCNGSTFEGHGYTFVNSIWGVIADALMEAGCMNLIIYIDEVDKISKSEHGNEITGILTHLIDSTQNDCFNDKYFNVPLDLSKVLFIFSYNDPALIDNILLDRIHRIKFDNLSLEEKVVIVRDYIIPDINKKMGMNDIVSISDALIHHVILYYTMEPGVRKLKELFFDMYGEINLDLLHNTATDMTLPLVLTTELIENKYLKQYDKIKEHVVHTLPIVGTINGLFANTRGRGGVLPIEVSLFPSSTFLDLKLTGLQGDVMKESMNVAKTLAWSLCSTEVKAKLIKQFEETMCQGIHVHCPEGSVSKDGPSAGTAETVAIYSVFNDLLINNAVAITGEIDLRGNITAIGGLEYKISGGIRAGVKKFIYPRENAKDFADFKKKTDIACDITFVEVDTIHDVFKHVFV
jgi:ATP-dependent Lon protease